MDTETIKPIIELVALVATALGVPIAAYQLWVGRREAQAGRDLSVALSLSESFREKWDAQWAAALVAAESGEPVDAEADAALQSMLNWVDWLGTLMTHGHLADSGVVLDTLAFAIRRLLDIKRDCIAADIEREGCGYWAGVLAVATIAYPEYEQQVCPR